MLSVGEGNGMVQVCATLSTVEASEKDLTVTLATINSNGTGIVGIDYISASSNLIFTSGSTDNAIRCINIFVLEDDALEGNQTVIVMLTTPDSDVTLGTGMTSIIITDNDG